MQDWFADHTYFLQHAFWNINDIVAWKGAYNQALERIGAGVSDEAAEREATQQADATVRLTQGSDNPEDVSLFQTGTPAAKLLTQFTSWSNGQANLHVSELTKAVRDLSGAERVKRLGYIYLSFMALHTVANGLVGIAHGKYSTDEPVLPQMLEWFFGSQIEGLVSETPYGNFMFPAAKAIAKDFTQGGASYDDQRTSSPAISAVNSSTVGVGRAAHDLADPAKQVSGRDVRDVLTMMTLLTGMPFATVGRPIGYAVDVNRGKIRPKSAADATRGALTGSASRTSRVR